jgi:hypothetical protein
MRENDLTHASAFALADAVTLLARTPATLDTLLRGLPGWWVSATEGPGTWSAFDVVGHLVHGEQTDWLPRIRLILEQGEQRPFEKFDREAQFKAPETETLETRLDTFARLRRENLRQLGELQLSDADLDRRGRHPALGPVTMRHLLATWTAHDLDHVMQICRVLGRQYADAVGPWRAYLRIISGEQG